MYYLKNCPGLLKNAMPGQNQKFPERAPGLAWRLREGLCKDVMSKLRLTAQ